MDTTTDHFTPLALRVRGNDVKKMCSIFTVYGDVLLCCSETFIYR